jgi:transcriptional regulator with XRE-family HTH domain
MAREDKNLGEVILNARKMMGLTLQDVSSRTSELENYDSEDYEGLSASYVSDVERRHRAGDKKAPIPNDKKMRTLAAALKVPFEDLHAALGRGDKPDASPIETIVEEAGFSSDGMSEDELADLREDVEDYVKVRIERMKAERKKRQKEGGA